MSDGSAGPAPPRRRTRPDGARLVVLVVLAGAAAALLVTMLWPFLAALVSAAVLALVLLPIHERMRTAMQSADLAALGTTLLALLVVVLPLVLISTMIATQAGAFADGIAQGMSGWGPRLSELGARADGWMRRLGLGDPAIGEVMQTRVRALPSILAGRAFSVAAGVAGTALQIGVGLFTLFYLLRDADRVGRAVRIFVPLDGTQMDQLLDQAKRTTAAAVYGHVLVAVVQGVLGGLLFWAVGIPGASLWGAIMCILSMIPLVGPAFVWLPAAGLLALSGSLGRAAVVAGFGILVISTVDNLIRALFVGSHARVHPLAIFFGVLGGLFTFGAAGIFVGPVLIVLALELLEMARLATYPATAARALPPAAGSPGD